MVFSVFAEQKCVLYSCIYRTERNFYRFHIQTIFNRIEKFENENSKKENRDLIALKVVLASMPANENVIEWSSLFPSVHR